MFSTNWAGVFLFPFAVLLPVGIYQALKPRRSALHVVMLLGFFTAPLAAALVAEQNAIFRGLVLLPFAALLATMLRRAGVPSGRVRRVDVGANPTAALLSGRVDAYYGDDAPAVAAALRARHKRVEVVSPGRLGLPRYDGLVFVTRIFYFCLSTHLTLPTIFSVLTTQVTVALQNKPASVTL